MTIPGLGSRHRPPYRLAGVVLLAVLLAALVAVLMSFAGSFTPTTRLTLLSDRAGLVLDPGAKVTFNGVPIGKVAGIEEVESDGLPAARLLIDVSPTYIPLIPANVDVEIRATTVFGNKYVAFSSPRDPSAARLSPNHQLTVRNVTTEFNTVFETVLELGDQIDPVKLNATLTAAADALDGFGDTFGRSIDDADAILDDLNPRMSQLAFDNRRLADLAEIYADASPDLWEFLRNSVVTVAAFNDERDNLDAALLAAIGVGNTGADTLIRATPYFVRSTADMVATAELLHEYSPEIFCTLRNYAEVTPRVQAAFGGANGYSLSQGNGTIGIGAPNAYVYPDNLPRTNARGGPAGKPGCWAPITPELWPAPYLVMDSGASIAPYNHLEIGQPSFIDYVWGRQIGERTINP